MGDVDEKDRMSLRREFSHAIGDIIVNCPTYFFSKEVAKSVENVYFYELTHKAQKSALNLGFGIECSDWMGVCHLEDITFVFGLPQQDKNNSYSEDDYKLAEIMMKVWADFARDG